MYYDYILLNVNKSFITFPICCAIISHSCINLGPVSWITLLYKTLLYVLCTVILNTLVSECVLSVHNNTSWQTEQSHHYSNLLKCLKSLHYKVGEKIIYHLPSLPMWYKRTEFSVISRRICRRSVGARWVEAGWAGFPTVPLPGQVSAQRRGGELHCRPARRGERAHGGQAVHARRQERQGGQCSVGTSSSPYLLTPST